MTVEAWAKNIVAKTLEREVEIYDDGSKPGMFDLIIGTMDAPEYAIECVGAVDKTSTETWNVGPANGPLIVKSSSDWDISIKPTARIKLLKRKICGIIKECENLGLPSFTPVNWQLEQINKSLYQALSELGITSLNRFRQNGQGRVHLSMDGDSGAVNQNSDALVEWIGTFLSSNDKADVVKKLLNSRAKENHVFIPIVLGGAPWNVASYFLGDMPLPSSHPELPNPINGVWITLNDKCVFYSRGKWESFSV